MIVEPMLEANPVTASRIEDSSAVKTFTNSAPAPMTPPTAAATGTLMPAVKGAKIVPTPAPNIAPLAAAPATPRDSSATLPF